MVIKRRGHFFLEEGEGKMENRDTDGLGAERYGGLALRAMRGLFASKEKIALSEDSFTALVSELVGFGLKQDEAVDFARRLILDLVNAHFDAIGKAAPAAASEDVPAGPPPSDDDVPF